MKTKTTDKVRYKVGRRAALLVGIFAVVAVVTLGANYNYNLSADAISPACYNSDDCMAAVKAEEEANANAAAAQEASNMYQIKVNELTSQIAYTERMIAESQARVEELTEQIKETEAKLLEEQEALAELLINTHFEGDSEPITILAGANSISDLAEKQARAEVVKQQISATATKIKEAKAKLEIDKMEVETQLESQKEMKEQLAATRAEQQQLVAKYASDAAAYEQAALAAIDAQREAELAEIEKHPELYQGGGYTGYNTFPWQDICPENNLVGIAYLENAVYVPGGGSYALGAMCQCTSYAGWKVWDRYRIAVNWGWNHAYAWDRAAANDGYRVDNIPEADSLGQSSDGDFGHVWWVESVNGDGSVNITEYNNPYATCLYQTGGDLTYCGYHYWEYPSGDFGSRTMSAAVAAQYNYVHFR
ncbi:CHAP domain-containing protein [Candidatus Saccharibacteria bacterium]|nr:CHAP domain-containing protein [Candidatus Saccharibacteria bacterium]